MPISGAMEQRAHSTVLPSVFLKGRYYMTQDQNLLNGSVPQKLIQFAFPLFLANLLQAPYNVVDMLVVGKIVGEIGLAAISNASMLCFIINSLCIGLTMGGSVLVAQYKGAGDPKGQCDTIGMLFLLSLAASVVVTMLGLADYEPLFRALDVPAEAYPDACGYMEIICWGTVFVFGYNTVCSILKGLGDSKTPLFFVGAATILNVLLDVLLVGPCSMGTAGAAWATIISQGISCIWVVAFLCGKKTYLRIRLSNLRIAPSVLLPCIGLGVSPFIMQMTESAISVCFNTSMRTYGGDDAVAAMTVLISVMQFSMLPLTGLSQGCQPIVSYNYGAGNEARVAKAFRLLLTCALTYSISLWALCLVRPGVLVAIFLDQPELSAYAQRCLRVFMSGSLFFGAQLACQQTFVALSRAKISVFLALLRKVILLIPLIYILPAVLPVNKVLAVILAEPVADLTAVTVTTTTFAIAFRRIRAEMRQRAKQ